MHVTKAGIDRIRSANPLEAVLVDRGIELRKKGRVLVARCPFHEEKTASFTVTPSKGLYHCFGCGARGDVIGFITKRDKVGFPRAMEILARRAALDLKEVMAERPAMAAPLAAPHTDPLQEITASVRCFLLRKAPLQKTCQGVHSLFRPA